MPIRPARVAHLAKSTAIGALRNRGFVDTFNWLVKCINNLKGRNGIKIENVAGNGDLTIKADCVYDVEIVDDLSSSSKLVLRVSYTDPNLQPFDIEIPLGGSGVAASTGGFHYDESSHTIRGGAIAVGRQYYSVSGMSIAADYTGPVRLRIFFDGSAMMEAEDGFQPPTSSESYVPLYYFVSGSISADYRNAPIVQSWELT